MPSSLAGLTVLVLDDNERAQAIWHRLLSAASAHHVGAGDVCTAQDLIALHPVDLVVIDEHLADPRMPGSAFALWMKSSGQPEIAAIPILACTSDRSVATDARLKAAGAGYVMAKPIDASEALLRLGELARQRSPRALDAARVD